MKKTISFIITATLLLASAVPAFAAPGDSKELEQAIQKVKSVIDISDEASIFDYNTWDDPESGKMLSLNWNDKNYEKSYNVSMNEEGVILSFNFYEYREGGGIGSLTREQGQKSAEAFLSKVLPASMKDCRLKDANSNDMCFSFTYSCYVNGFPVAGMLFSIDVDKFTGKVSSYYGNSVIRKKDVFPAAGEKIGEDKAREAFIGGAGVSLSYNSYYDYEKRELRVYPAFSVGGNVFVDVATGKIVEGYRSYYPYGMATKDAGGMRVEMAADASLTPEEQKVVDSVAGLMSKEEAVRAAAAIVPGLPSASKLAGANLSSSYEEKGRYYWHLRFDNCSVTVDAKSGELTSLYNYSEPGGKEGAVSEDAAKKTAMDFIKKAVGSKLEKTVYSERMSRPPYTFTYVREVNGIPFPGNAISISVDSASGKISYYNLSWYDSVDFPEISGAMAVGDAFGAFAAGGKFDLLYTRTDKDKIALAYGFIDAPDYSLDPFTGSKLGYDGRPYKERRPVDSYGDISGKWYEETVKSLLDNGYYLEGADFKGGAQITQEEFLRYMHSPMQAYYSQDEFYSMLERNKIVLKEEKAPDSALVRQDAAKFAIRFMGLDKAAKDGSIFKNMFSDAVAPDYAGYAALAKSLGVMQGDTAGNFNGGKTMTRAEAAAVVFNLLKNN
ncbi:MAG: S-layer homology domain-containing protein [Clostridiales bacterium]|nr:S-layer homology domain-containing protein [Clostridiales bacterium]